MASRICFVIIIGYSISLHVLLLNRVLQGYLCVVGSPSIAYTVV